MPSQRVVCSSCGDTTPMGLHTWKMIRYLWSRVELILVDLSPATYGILVSIDCNRTFSASIFRCPQFLRATGRGTTISSKVNMPLGINFRTLRGANLVTLRSKFQTKKNLKAHRVKGQSGLNGGYIGNRAILSCLQVPAIPGGGTVDFVTPEFHVYSQVRCQANSAQTRQSWLDTGPGVSH